MLTYAPIPTTDLYFLNSCGDLVARPWRRGPVARLGANVFQCGNRYLVIRRDRTKVIERVLANPKADPSLPHAYRGRLLALREGIFTDMMARATLVVTSATQIAEGIAEKGIPVRVINPAWGGRPRPDALPYQPGQRFDVVHLGTGSHGAGFDFLTPSLAHVLEKAADLHFHYFSNSARLGVLDAHTRVHRHRARTWRSYRQALSGFRFHLGLYPLPPTPFNNARSVNKILEYTLAGCPAMYSAAWGEAHGLQDGKTAFLVTDDARNTGDGINSADIWSQRLLDVIAAPDLLSGVYGGAKTVFEQMNDLPGQRAFWQDVFIRDGR